MQNLNVVVSKSFSWTLKAQQTSHARLLKQNVGQISRLRQQGIPRAMKKIRRTKLNLKILRKMSSKSRMWLSDLIQMMREKARVENGRIAMTTQTKKWRSTRQVTKLQETLPRLFLRFGMRQKSRLKREKSLSMMALPT